MAKTIKTEQLGTQILTPIKSYVDSKVSGVDNTFYFKQFNNGGVVTYSMTFAELKAMYDANKQGIFVGSGQNTFPFLTFNYYGPADAGGERIQFKTEVGSNNDQLRVFTILPDNTGSYEYVNVGGTNIGVNQEKWYGTYTDENGVTYQAYTKTIYIPALPDVAGITTYPHGITNIKQILGVYGFTSDGFVLNAPRQSAADNISIYQVQKSATGGVAIEVGKDRSSKSAYVVIIYAKNN